MQIIGREPTRRNIMDGILSGAIPVRDIASLSTEQRLALQTIVLSPIISRFVQGFDTDRFIDSLEVLPLETNADVVRRTFNAYIFAFKPTAEALLRAQLRGEFGDPRRQNWTKLFAQHFQNDVAILEPIESAYKKIGGDLIEIIPSYHKGALSLTDWGTGLMAALPILTGIASLRKEDSDRVIKPLRQNGDLQNHVVRRGGKYGLDFHQLVPTISRTGRGCPMNSLDPEGAPEVDGSLLRSVHQQFADVVIELGHRYNR